MAAEIESLNVATAAGLIVYEAFRQRTFPFIGSETKP
jgi:tRNA G18 (ribose-2'-O)-methylase SpoU